MLGALMGVILPVFLIAAVGFGLARRFTIDPLSINKVQLYALTPALAYMSIMQAEVSLADAGRLGAGYLLVTAAAGVVAQAARRGLPIRTDVGFVPAVMIGNNGNFGLPIALLALGQPGLDQAIVILVFAIVVTWTVGPALFGAQTTVRGVLGNIARLPVIWTMLLALVFRGIGFEPPAGVSAAVQMVGDASIPMLLLALGIQLGYAKRIRPSGAVLVAVILKLIAVPLLAWGIGWLVGLRGLGLQSLVLALAMPTAVNVLLFGLEYDRDVEALANIVALSTLASLATITVLLAKISIFT